MRALLDQSSQTSLITENGAQQLGLPRQKCQGVITGIGAKQSSCKGAITIKCFSTHSNFEFQTDVLIMKNLIKSLPSSSFVKPEWSFLDNITLADPEFNHSRPVDILFGADIYSLILLEGICRGEQNNSHIAQSTRLGWILSGCARTLQGNVVLNDLDEIQRFWEIEDIAGESNLSSDDQECVQYYKSTTTRQEDGRYEVRLPMKTDFEKNLGLSKNKAVAQFKSSERKFTTEKANYTSSTAAAVLESSFYMDDLVHGAHRLEDAKQLREDLINLLKSGGFNLRKWKSNVLELSDANMQNNPDNFNFKKPESSKTLGLSWNQQKDVFIFSSKIEPTTGKETKRSILSDISKLFDPVGWLAPLSTKLKIIFQKVWLSKITWDDPLPEDILSDWISIKNDITNISKLQVPRWMSTNAHNVIELHGFCDASVKAYACVIYCKVYRGNNQPIITLLVAKTRIVPCGKSITIPKLELSAAHLLSKLMLKVQQCLSTYHIKIYGWSNSKIVLGWLNGDPSRWKTYVANRVVTNVMPATCWRHVKSEVNPADCASRGLTASQLTEQDLWWQGPSWLVDFDGLGDQPAFITDQEMKKVLREIENVYFKPPSEFDAARYVLQNLPDPLSCEEIERMFTTPKRQQQVVSGKALHLISQQRDTCDREFTEIQSIRDQLAKTMETCRQARNQLRTASNHLTISTFVILANFRKRQIIRSVLKSLELLRSLRSVEKDAADLLNRKEYYDAIELILRSRKAAASHKQFTCITDLTARLQDTLDMTEEKLDSVLSTICYNFEEQTFRKLRKAYALLGKTQAAMEQLHMHYSSTVNESAMDAVRNCASVGTEMKFQEMCQSVQPNKAPTCLLNLCENLFLIMKSYYLLVNWHSKHDDDEAPSANNVMEIEKNVSKEYIRQKLKAGLARIWHDVQAKVSTFLKSSALEDYPFEKFIQMLGILRKLTQVAEVFCGDKCDLLQDFIKTQSVTYIKNYHKGRMEELRLFLENEGWEQCPVRSTFTLLNLQEFRQFKRYISRTETLSTKTLSDGNSSVHSQDDSVYITKNFQEKTNHTPFEIFRNENVTNDDIFGLEKEDSDVEESDDELDELKRDYVDENERIDSPSRVKESVIVTNTTLSVLRHCGQYLQICRYLPQISLEVIMLMNQLFEYYLYTVHLFFSSDLDVASSTLYTAKLNAALKRISNNIEGEGDGKGPLSPSHLNLGLEENLHGLAERIVAVESLVFLAKQFQILQPYLETIVAPHQRMLIQHFRDNTLTVAQDLRAPVYMCSASRGIDARATLSAMMQVKWDVKSVAVQHSPYIDMVTRCIQVFALRLETVAAKVSLNIEVVNSVWTALCKFIVHLLVEGFSNATKCSNGGRGLMQLDYRQLFLKLEKISKLKPVPYQDYVDTYVKAYYLPRKGLEEFVVEKTEYSYKHLTALVTCACENKKDRQALITLLEGRDTT